MMMNNTSNNAATDNDIVIDIGIDIEGLGGGVRRTEVVSIASRGIQDGPAADPESN